MPDVHVLKLEQTDAFVVRDLGDDVPAVGAIRLAPKILQEGAELLARSLTYAFASFEQKRSGASGGINTKPDGRGDAVTAFVAGVRPLVESGDLALDPAKGLDNADFEGLREVDGRPALYHEHAAELRGLGAAVCADAAVPLDGRAVTIEGFDAAGPALVQAIGDRGGRVTAIGTAQGVVVKPSGLDPLALAEAWREHGPALVEHLDAPKLSPSDLWSAEADVLFCGSKAGVVDHEVATTLSHRAVVPTGPVPVTAKALAALQRSDVVVLPDFITTAGPLFALERAPEGAPDLTADAVRATASAALLDVLGEVLGHERGPVLGACLRAESFLASWRDELPFGRPLA